MHLDKSITVALIIPTLNAEAYIPPLFKAIMRQSLLPQHILVIDSDSSDQTRELLSHYPIEVHRILQKNFDHGGTRKWATGLVQADVYLFMTQDALPAHPDTFKNLIAALMAHEKTGCAYGRQLPKEDATLLNIFDRSFNYPALGQLRTYADKNKYGLKTCFNSNSFAAYKQQALREVGGFPTQLIMSEDAYVAAKMLLQGWSVHYVAEAAVYHSHNLSLREKFHRYFSAGVFHSKEAWLIRAFSGASAEGLRYVLAQLKFLIKNKRLDLIPYALLGVVLSYSAYQLGLKERFLPYFLKKSWGVNKKYWVAEKAKLAC